MKQREIEHTELARAMGRRALTRYMEHVVDHGHVPGTLSGASLKGDAKKYGASYARTRANVAHAVRVLGYARDGYDERGRRVWVDPQDGEPIELTVRYSHADE